jgi:hypothetical protein
MDRGASRPGLIPKMPVVHDHFQLRDSWVRWQLLLAKAIVITCHWTQELKNLLISQNLIILCWKICKKINRLLWVVTSKQPHPISSSMDRGVSRLWLLPRMPVVHNHFQERNSRVMVAVTICQKLSSLSMVRKKLMFKFEILRFFCWRIGKK